MMMTFTIIVMMIFIVQTNNFSDDVHAPIFVTFMIIDLTKRTNIRKKTTKQNNRTKTNEERNK